MQKTDEIAQIISKELNRDISNSTKLLSSGVIDSISLMGIIVELEKKYHITIDPIEISPLNFDSLDGIATLIDSKLS
jgi:acyl carrier protein